MEVVQASLVKGSQTHPQLGLNTESDIYLPSLNFVCPPHDAARQLESNLSLAALWHGVQRSLALIEGLLRKTLVDLLQMSSLCCSAREAGARRARRVLKLPVAQPDLGTRNTCNASACCGES